MALDKDIALLRQAPLLAVLGDEALRLVAFSAETRLLRTGEVLFREGQPADSGYVVVEGGFVVADKGGLGERTAARGALLGEMALIVETVRPASAVAREPSAVMRIPRPLFLRVLAEFPDAARRVQTMISDNLKATTADLRRVGDQLLAVKDD